MSKKKLTLSISRDLLNETKLYAHEIGRSLSSIVEEYFEYLASTRWIDALAKELGLEKLEPSTESEIPMSRPAGLNATKIVRELRKSRVEAILHDIK